MGVLEDIKDGAEKLVHDIEGKKADVSPVVEGAVHTAEVVDPAVAPVVSEVEAAVPVVEAEAPKVEKVYDGSVLHTVLENTVLSHKGLVCVFKQFERVVESEFTDLLHKLGKSRVAVATDPVLAKDLPKVGTAAHGPVLS